MTTSHRPRAPAGTHRLGGDPTTVALVTLGCARNEVDSEELAGRLEAGGFRLVEDPADAETVVVNTCGFVEAAKKDSVDTLLEAADLKGGGHRRRPSSPSAASPSATARSSATSLPEADAVLGFDDYPDIADRLRGILAGEAHAGARAAGPPQAAADLPRPRGTPSAAGVVVPGHTIAAPDLPADLAPRAGPRAVRRRLDGGPMAPLKLASGCDRRCSFCAIPSFRGSFVSRRPSDVLGEARWLAEQGVKELFLVSENSTSYGKDLGDLRLLETLLPELAAVDGVERVRVSYLQPAETRPGLIGDRRHPGRGGLLRPVLPARVGAGAAPDAPLRRPRQLPVAARRGRAARRRAAGVRSNVIVGFPGETEDDLETLCDFLTPPASTWSACSGTPTRTAPRPRRTTGSSTTTRSGPASSTSRRWSRSSPRSGRRTASAQRVSVLVESVDESAAEGRAEHQGPEVDGVTSLPAGGLQVGDVVPAVVVAAEGVDLVAEVTR